MILDEGFKLRSMLFKHDLIVQMSALLVAVIAPFTRHEPGAVLFFREPFQWQRERCVCENGESQ